MASTKSLLIYIALPLLAAGFAPQTREIRKARNTAVYAEPKKTPRFSQQAHAKARSTKAKKTIKPKPWDTGKSLEDLENSMTNRWGTLDRPKQNQNQRRRRAVADPWQNDKGAPPPPPPPPPPQELEWYDEDDEGFEIEFEDEEQKKEKGTRESRIKVSHLISPKPVGGRGTNSVKEEPSSESYFFNPKKEPVEPVVSEEKPSNPTTQRRKLSEPKQSSSPAKPLLGEDGNPILLTTDEALFRFQDGIDEEMLEVIESADIPIVAIKGNDSWEDLGVTSKIILENLRGMDCAHPLSVQAKACPAILTGNDALVGTYTGSGKTLAFLTPIVEKLLWDDTRQGVSTIIVAPGRELASQIASVARRLVDGTDIKVQLAIGGTTFSRSFEQIRKKKPDIIVGTPGRIAELIVGKPGEKSGKLKIGDLQYLVMDEFDALLDYKPHRDPTRAILAALNRRHGDALQSVFCSATAADCVEKVAEYLRPGFATCNADDDDALVTSSGKARVSKTVLHGVVHIPHRRFALDAVRRILHTEPVPQQILIFAESARKVDIVVDKLADQGIIAAPLHGGNKSEKMDRAEISRALREGYVGIVVATEMAARGLDAPLLTHVINLDLPTDASHYAHRAGRCGRGGRPGVVINFTTSPKERKVPQRFADSLGIELHSVEPREGKLMFVDPDSQTLD